MIHYNITVIYSKIIGTSQHTAILYKKFFLHDIGTGYLLKKEWPPIFYSKYGIEIDPLSNIILQKLYRFLCPATSDPVSENDADPPVPITS